MRLLERPSSAMLGGRSGDGRALLGLLEMGGLPVGSGSDKVVHEAGRDSAVLDVCDGMEGHHSRASS